MDRIPYVPQLRPGDDMPVINQGDGYLDDLFEMFSTDQTDTQSNEE